MPDINVSDDGTNLVVNNNPSGHVGSTLSIKWIPATGLQISSITAITGGFSTDPTGSRDGSWTAGCSITTSYKITATNGRSTSTATGKTPQITINPSPK